MWLAAFYILGTLLALSVCDICPENAASWVKLNPLGDCGDEEVLCPYRLTLPPLSIQLPRPFRELEEMAKELKNLKEVVNQLRRDCQECKSRQSFERGGWIDHREEEEMRSQHPKINISIKDAQSPGGEKVTRIITSTLPQGDTSESEGSEKRPNPSILDGREWNINQRIDSAQGSTDLTSEMSREVRIFNPLLDEVPEDISKVPIFGEITEPSLAMKKDDVQSGTHGKLQPNVLSDGHAKNISDILTVRRRVQNVPDLNGLRDPSTKTMDLSTSAGNRRVVNFPGGSRPLRPRGSYINSKVVSVNNGARLKNPASVRKTNPQVGEAMNKTEPEEDGFSPARSGIMRVKETSPRIANTKSGGISGASPSTDDQNKQDISRVSGPKTDDGHASQVTRVSEDSLRNINKTKITRIPTNLRKEKQDDVSHTDANKSGSSIMNSAEQPNTVKEEKEHMGLSESLVVISSPAVNKEDLPFPGRQVEFEKYLNPITETNNGQIGSTILDEADSSFNARTVKPLSPDLTGEMQLETFIAGAIEETGLNLLNTETVDIKSNSKATLSEDLVKPTIVPTVKSKSIITNMRITSRSKSPVGGHGTRRTSKTPLKEVTEQLQDSKKNISMIHEVKHEHEITTAGSKLRPTVTGKISVNRSTGVPSKLSIPVRNGNAPRKNISGIIKPNYTRTKPNFLIELNVNRGIKTKVSTTNKFFSPTGATPIIEREKIKHISPKVIRPNMLDNHRLKINITESEVRDLERVQEGINRTGDISETVLISKKESSLQDPNTMQSGTSKLPMGETERNIFSLGDANINGQNPSEGDKMSSGKKRTTLKREFSKKPGASQGTALTVSFTAPKDENVHIVTNTHIEMSKNLSRDTPRTFENIGPSPNVKPNVLQNLWLKINNTDSKKPSKPQNAGKTQVGDLISNREDPSIRQSESTNSPNGGKESKIFSLGTAGEVDNRRKGPNVKKELSKEPGIIQPAIVSIRDTENIGTVTNPHVETPKNISGDTPIRFENIRATKEQEHIKLNNDRVDENPGEVLSNQNSLDTAQSYSGEKYTIPVVSERLPNVEEIKGSKLFSLSPEDTADGLKSHAVSDEVTEREKSENKLHSTCLNDCNTTSTQYAQPRTSQRRTPLGSEGEKGPAQDCADYMMKSRKNGVYRVTPRLKKTPFPVFCDMESLGGGWTVIQHRFDGSTSFNRTWDEYKNGFGKLMGEFWLGNDKIHLLTKTKNMSLRIEIEDLEGIREYAQYDRFFVANESQNYRLSIDSYSGTAGNALQFSKKYNHDQKFFTTPDRDNDQYPSGNCGAYYSSGWWFDACMSANLNGKYYQSKYKGVRNGIFWGTWHNITMEYYPSNERQSFRTVKMMIRPKK